ncbi:MAG: DUF2892 domain-containing protein [Bacteroidota bacterium]|nr:DUF2892 domain-containing protein [Bacteroidota bacterium]
MAFIRNMGSVDRILRLLVAVVIAVLYLTGSLSGPLALVLGILAIAFAVTSLIGFCPLYAPFRLSTRRR